MGYGRKTGYSGYASGLPSGARVIELSINPFKKRTWIRTEDEKITNFNIHKPNINETQTKCHRMTVSPKDYTWILYLILIVGFLIFGYFLYKYFTKRKTLPSISKDIKSV